MVNAWKVIAITFIILFVLETSLLAWTVVSTIGNMDNENICIYDICESSSIFTYDAYTYDSDSKLCRCYLDSKIIKEERII